MGGALQQPLWFVRLYRTRGRWGGATSYQPPRSDWLPILTRHSCDCFLQRKLLSLENKAGLISCRGTNDQEWRFLFGPDTEDVLKSRLKVPNAQTRGPLLELLLCIKN
ncbi:hypothetical protein PFLUV_G00256780 [Perca fluviatilis]|uniref:Uncharacterized protein n=1 Tax=Perca fluviatilis TaxID=8168 RepID=A0A6A5DNK8_PERFL|nr:hypothetical protein PFLUV_G00256780 [Perca fluviatilis]